MIEVAARERVTVVRHHPLRSLRGHVDERGLIKLDTGAHGFTVVLDEEDRFEIGGQARVHNIWSFIATDAAEGLGWCRGWGKFETEALLAANALR